MNCFRPRVCVHDIPVNSEQSSLWLQTYRTELLNFLSGFGLCDDKTAQFPLFCWREHWTRTVLIYSPHSCSSSAAINVHLLVLALYFLFFIYIIFHFVESCFQCSHTLSHCCNEVWLVYSLSSVCSLKHKASASTSHTSSTSTTTSRPHSVTTVVPCCGA